MRGIHLKMLSSRSIRSHGDENKESRDAAEALQRLNQIEKFEANNGDPEVLRLKGADEADRPPRNAHVTNWDIFFLVFSIFTHIVDVGLDINLATRYLLNDKKKEFYWTIAFILIPTIVNTLISIRMHYQDVEMSEDLEAGKDVKESGTKSATRVVAQRKACCILVLLFQLAPVLRYIDSLRYALRARKCERTGDKVGQRYNYCLMLKEDQDVALLRVFECFLEAAPQQILQLTIILDEWRNQKNAFQWFHQMGSVSSSLVSMGWAMVSYHRSIRLAQRDKPNISIAGTIAQFFWHFCVTVSRILSISVCATIWPLSTGLGCVAHWAGMSLWLIRGPLRVTEFCRDRSRAPHSSLTAKERAGSILFAALFGTVYIFTYLNPSEGRTFYRHFFYYTLCLLENVIAASLWAYSATPEFKENWYFYLLIVLCAAPFLIGIFAMILYYVFFHPSTKCKSSPPTPPEPS